MLVTSETSRTMLTFAMGSISIPSTPSRSNKLSCMRSITYASGEGPCTTAGGAVEENGVVPKRRGELYACTARSEILTGWHAWFKLCGCPTYLRAL